MERADLAAPCGAPRPSPAGAGLGTIAVAAIAHVADAPLETAPGEAIPIVGSVS